MEQFAMCVSQDREASACECVAVRSLWHAVLSEDREPVQVSL